MSESSSLLPGDVVVALGGLPVKTAACVEVITAAWPKSKTLCATLVRNGELVSISFDRRRDEMHGGVGEPYFTYHDAMKGPTLAECHVIALSATDEVHEPSFPKL